ncbi:DUF1841 family protein [candidate division KSB1 bacterium]|nr:DUF1841 family protein [candidate division KSB1 bacterium]
MKKDFKNFMLKSSRQHIFKIWNAAKNNNLDSLDDEELVLLKIMMEHKDEFHNVFEFSDVFDDYEFDPESETNPFLHIIFHSIIENQLQAKDPIEAYQFFNTMRNKRTNRHDVIHMIANIFSHFLYHTLKEGKPFDEEMYRASLDTLKEKRPDKVWATLEKGLDRFNR